MPQTETATPTWNIDQKPEHATIYKVPGVIKIKIPPNAKDIHFRDEKGGEVHMVQFTHTITGGVVNFFLHLSAETDDKALCNRRIFAYAVIKQKTVPNGARFLFVDLYLAEDQTPRQADYTFVVVPKVSDAQKIGGAIFFHPAGLQDTKPLSGAIVVTEIKKAVMGPKKEPVPPETSPIKIVEEVPAQPK